jgi:hypothetical protein
VYLAVGGGSAAAQRLPQGVGGRAQKMRTCGVLHLQTKPLQNQSTTTPTISNCHPKLSSRLCLPTTPLGFVLEGVLPDSAS